MLNKKLYTARISLDELLKFELSEEDLKEKVLYDNYNNKSSIIGAVLNSLTNNKSQNRNISKYIEFRKALVNEFLVKDLEVNKGNNKKNEKNSRTKTLITNSLVGLRKTAGSMSNENNPMRVSQKNSSLVNYYFPSNNRLNSSVKLGHSGKNSQISFKTYKTSNAESNNNLNNKWKKQETNGERYLNTDHNDNSNKRLSTFNNKKNENCQDFRNLYYKKNSILKNKEKLENKEQNENLDDKDNRHTKDNRILKFDIKINKASSNDTLFSNTRGLKQNNIIKFEDCNESDVNDANWDKNTKNSSIDVANQLVLYKHNSHSLSNFNRCLKKDHTNLEFDKITDITNKCNNNPKLLKNQLTIVKEKINNNFNTRNTDQYKENLQSTQISTKRDTNLMTNNSILSKSPYNKNLKDKVSYMKFKRDNLKESSSKNSFVNQGKTNDSCNNNTDYHLALKTTKNQSDRSSNNSYYKKNLINTNTNTNSNNNAYANKTSSSFYPKLNFNKVVLNNNIKKEIYSERKSINKINTNTEDNNDSDSNQDKDKPKKMNKIKIVTDKQKRIFHLKRNIIKNNIIERCNEFINKETNTDRMNSTNNSFITEPSFEQEIQQTKTDTTKPKTKTQMPYDGGDLVDEEFQDQIKFEFTDKSRANNTYTVLVDKVKTDNSDIEKFCYITENVAKVVTYGDLVARMNCEKAYSLGKVISDTYSNYSKKMGLEKQFSNKDYKTYTTKNVALNIRKEKIFQRRLGEILRKYRVVDNNKIQK